MLVIKYQQAVTILESMLGLVFASILSCVLLSGFLAFKKGYDCVMTLSTVDDDGRLAITILRHNINTAEAVIALIPQAQIGVLLQKQLKSKSDVLILQQHDQQVAFYLAWASWQQDGMPVESLFEKSLDGRRVELVSHVTSLHFKNAFNGISYELTVRSAKPLLRFVHHFFERYVYRHWYGFAAQIGRHHVV